MEQSGQPTGRENRLLEIEAALVALTQNDEKSYFHIGALLHEVRENALWGDAANDFKGWIESPAHEYIQWPTVGSSYAWVCNCANCWKYYVAGMGKPVEELLAVGRSKLIRMLPLARKGQIPDAIWQAALNPMVKDIQLREMMGHKVKELGDEDKDSSIEVDCPRCGNRFEVAGAKWT